MTASEMGKRRMAMLTSEERSALARHAIQERWRRHRERTEGQAEEKA